MENQYDDIKKKNEESSNIFGYSFTMLNEYGSAKIMLILLNILLLIVNFLDAEFLFFGLKLPEGVSYSDFVHQGIGSLIISIITAVAIIIWYFRGELNFYKDKKTLKTLAYIWIIQNLLMIVSNIYRNSLYIEEYNLTYKRIGVYIFLTLAIIGIIITAIKISKVKSNWYLFKINGLAFYIFLIISCFINWDMVITHYNISHSISTRKQLDEWYIYSLSDQVLPDLYIWSIYNKNICSPHFIKSLHEKISYFNWEKSKVDWRSWNIESHRTSNDLKEMHLEGD